MGATILQPTGVGSVSGGTTESVPMHEGTSLVPMYVERKQAWALGGLLLPLRVQLAEPMSDEDLMAFCARNELLKVEREPNGNLTFMSPSGSNGGSQELEAASQLSVWAKMSGLGKAFGSNAGFTMLDGAMRAADSAFVSWARWNALTREEQRSYAPICPEFVIEIRSPSDRLNSLREKMGQWLANGAELAWLIDPDAKTVEIYRPGRAAELLEAPTTVFGEGPVVGFVLETAPIWQE